MGDASPSWETVANEVQWGEDYRPRAVTITHLEMVEAPQGWPAVPPAGVRIERVKHVTPELVRWLYSVVGGPYRWYERLGWDRESWASELAEQGSEVWLVSVDGTPAGYCQLASEVVSDAGADKYSTEVEILYFGLMQWAHGRGLGRIFLEQMIHQAWKLSERHALPQVSRVWVHTCDLDAPAALVNYQARGMEICKVEEHSEIVLKHPLSSWEAMFES